MAVRLLPLTVSELCGHALELERDAAQRFSEYARRTRELGARGTSSLFESLAVEQQQEVSALELATGERKAAELSPWEYAWRLTYMPEAMEQRPRVVPVNAREALQLAVMAKRRAESFYNDVGENARDAVVRSCALEMATSERAQIRRLQRQLNLEQRTEENVTKSGDGDARARG
jgi:rubrerythrin